MTTMEEQALSVSKTITPLVTQLCLTHDVRAVIAALLGRAAQLSQAAIAAGCDKTFIEGMIRGTTESAFAPTDVVPEVRHLIDDEVTNKGRLN